MRLSFLFLIKHHDRTVFLLPQICLLNLNKYATLKSTSITKKDNKIKRYNAFIQSQTFE